MVEVIMTEANDWIIIRYDGDVVHEGHSISNTDFCCILREMGQPVKEILISDEMMEQGEY